ncbi:hypothetical protein G9A89_018286 [Geosiphon pyriformis]|nr:hypothetical protein G9A89_018286 [Geosiphon pyriformis]
MVLDSPDSLSNTLLPIATDSPALGSSSSKVLTSKLDSLKSKFVALEVLDRHCSSSLNEQFGLKSCNDDIICWHKEMNNVISIITETKLKDKVHPWIMDKFDGIRVFISGLESGHLGSRFVLDILGRLLSLRLLFKNNLSVSVLGLYTGASLVVCFFQADNVNSLIAKAVNESSFVILSGDFNEDSSHKSASFKKCFDLSLVNFLGGSSYGKEATWNNFRGVAKTIDCVFVSSNLVNVILDHNVAGIEEFFDTNHSTVFVSVGLGDATAANAAMLSDDFAKWFKGFDCVFTKMSSKFYKLKLLVSKLVKASCESSITYSFFLSDFNFDAVCSLLAKARKFYCSSKLLKSRHAEESQIKQAIDRRMEGFELDKGHTIRSVLERPFRKVVLDHLVVDEELILEPELVKSKVDEIMESWTRKHAVKHCDKSVLDMLLVLLNFCLAHESVSMIPKPYEWKGILTNTCPIALIETACKVLSKILSDKIPLACSNFDILCGDNFSVLRGTSTHSPIFTVGLVVENALEKNQELWCMIVWIKERSSLSSFGTYFTILFYVKSNDRKINDISINIDKTVAIPINCRINALSLFISGSPISIAKKGKSHHYLGIFLSTKGLSKPSLAKAHTDVRFFTNLVLKKTISDKQHLALFSSSSYVVDNLGLLNILKSSQFDMVCNNLLSVEANSLSVYTDGFVAGLGTTGMKAGAAVFFENVGMGLGIEVSGLVSSTLVELQAIALALEYAYNSASSSECFLFLCLKEHFILADGCVVSSNTRHFARDIFRSIHHAHWEVSSGLRVVVDNLLADIDCYLKLMSPGASNGVVFTALCKGVVFNDWFLEAVSIFGDSKIAGHLVIDFV